MNIDGNGHAHLESRADSRLVVAGTLGGVVAEESKDVGADHLAVGEVGGIEHVRDTCRVKIDDEAVVANHDVLKIYLLVVIPEIGQKEVSCTFE